MKIMGKLSFISVALLIFTACSGLGSTSIEGYYQCMYNDLLFVELTEDTFTTRDENGSYEVLDEALILSSGEEFLLHSKYLLENNPFEGEIPDKKHFNAECIQVIADVNLKWIIEFSEDGIFHRYTDIKLLDMERKTESDSGTYEKNGDIITCIRDEDGAEFRYVVVEGVMYSAYEKVPHPE